MGKFKILTGLALTVATLSLAWVGFASAHSFHTGTNVVVKAGEPIHDTVFAAGRNVDVNNEVFGDVFCAGQTVTVSGTIHGDVICAGQTVHVTGKVNGDVRLAGQTVTVSAEIMGNATIAGQSFLLESSGKIGGDVTVGSTDANFNGPVGRDIAVGGDSVVVSGVVGRNITGNLNNLTLDSNARVNGNIEFTSVNDVDKAEGAVVSGKVIRSETKKPAQSKNGAIFGFGLGWFVYCLLAVLFTSMVIALLFPRALQTVTDKATPRPWKALLTGFLASVSLPIVLILLAITVVGLPLAFIVGLLWVVVMLLAGPLFGYYLGRLILPGSKRPLLIMLVGATVLVVAYFIPIIGLITFLAAMWIGAGMLLLEVFQRTPKPSYDLARSSHTKVAKS